MKAVSLFLCVTVSSLIEHVKVPYLMSYVTFNIERMTVTVYHVSVVRTCKFSLVFIVAERLTEIEAFEMVLIFCDVQQ
jgi:hypothetical protein